MKLGTDQVQVRAYLPRDKVEWMRMRLDLWPDSGRADAEAWANRQDAITLVAEDKDQGILLGFAEVGQRLYADGCHTSPVAFLEGWYVVPESRRQKVGWRLVQAAVQWTKSQGLCELASDSLLHNEASYRAHVSVRLLEVERSIKYRLPVA